ncbi:MAG: ABC transporter permease [Dorea sp.]|nr:ABC transporter permease [Dorea sp.]
MMEYLLTYYDKLFGAAVEHLQIILVSMALSLAVAMILTVLCDLHPLISGVMLSFLSMVYSVPSLAMLAILIPVTGLGRTTAIVVLVIYNQYLLLRNFMAGLDGVDKSVVEAATGLGMSSMQVLVRIKLPLSKRPMIAGIRIALVSTVSIATIAASINAGGLGTILFDGLRTMNASKILWGSILSALLAVLLDWFLGAVEKRL